MWQLLPIELVYHILNFVHGQDFINVCNFIGKVRRRLSMRELENSKEYLWKRVKSDLQPCLFNIFPGLSQYGPLSLYRKYFGINIKPKTKLEVDLYFDNFYMTIEFIRDSLKDDLCAYAIRLDYVIGNINIVCKWERKHKFTIYMINDSHHNFYDPDFVNCEFSYNCEPYDFSNILKPVSPYTTFNLFRDRITAIIEERFKLYV